MSEYTSEVTIRSGLRESGDFVHSAEFPETAYYQLTDEEFDRLHPRPTLKHLLLFHKSAR